jgi:hypothetical protein
LSKHPSEDERRERIARIRQQLDGDFSQRHYASWGDVLFLLDLLASPASDCAGPVDCPECAAVGSGMSASPAVSREPLISDPNNRWNKMALAASRASRDVGREPDATLREALQEIHDGDGSCLCAHDDENCCVVAGEFCPSCIAAVALAAQPSPASPTPTHGPSVQAHRPEPSEAYRDSGLPLATEVYGFLDALDVNWADFEVTALAEFIQGRINAALADPSSSRPCTYNGIVSRICERGSSGCEIRHGDPSSAREEPPSRADTPQSQREGDHLSGHGIQTAADAFPREP